MYKTIECKPTSDVIDFAVGGGVAERGTVLVNVNDADSGDDEDPRPLIVAQLDPSQAVAFAGALLQAAGFADLLVEAAQFMEEFGSGQRATKFVPGKLRTLAGVR